MRVSQIFVTYGAEGKERDFARIIDFYSTIRFVLAVSHAFVDSVECRQLLSSRRMKNEYLRRLDKKMIRININRLPSYPECSKLLGRGAGEEKQMLFWQILPAPLCKNTYTYCVLTYRFNTRQNTDLGFAFQLDRIYSR